MTNQPTAELIAEIKQWMSDHSHFHSARRRDVTRLLAALEAAEQERDSWKLSAEEAERAEKRWKDRAIEAERELQVAEDQANNLAGDLAQAEKERDALDAVVEEVRAEVTRTPPSGFGYYLPSGNGLRTILAASPADALREVKAAVWAEGHDAGWEDRHQDALAGWMPSDSYESEAVNPYRAREEQA